MEPSKKAWPIEEFLEEFGGRSTAIKNNRCVDKPIGCGRDVYPDKENWDRETMKEYTISGLCPQCQRRVFD